MIRSTIIAGLLVISAFFGACASEQKNAEAPGGNAAQPVSQNRNAVEVANTAAVNTANVPLAEANANKRDVRTDSGVPLPPLQFQKLADGTEVATDMTKEGNLKQIRLFKTDRILSKVESVWLDATMKEVTLYLRSGKTATVKTDKLGDLKFESVAALLELAGISAEPADRPRIVDKKAEPK